MSLLDRNITIIANYLLDNIIPPVLRDFKFFMYPIIWLAYGRETKLLLEFKEKFPFMSDTELSDSYRRILKAPINTERKTDLNKTCLSWITKNVSTMTGTVLDAACGRGYLLSKIIESNPHVQCCGVDIAPPDEIYHGEGVAISFNILAADITNLPFENHSFDVVLCTHALEHIRDPKKALCELIRVTRRRLIIVVPRQREYRYTVDLHVNFFPYMHDFRHFIGIENAKYFNLNGDFLCCIDF